MTVQAQDSVQYYDGPINVGAVIPITDFTFIDNSHVSMKIRNVDGIWEYGVDYIIEGAGTLDRYAIIQRAVEKGQTLAVYLDVPITQNISPEEGGNFPASTNEFVLDKLTYICQMLYERVARSMQVSIDNPFDGTLSVLVPGKAIKINAAGNGLELSDLDPDQAVVEIQNYIRIAEAAAEAAEQSKDKAQEIVNGLNVTKEQVDAAAAAAIAKSEEAIERVDVAEKHKLNSKEIATILTSSVPQSNTDLHLADGSVITSEDNCWAEFHNKFMKNKRALTDVKTKYYRYDSYNYSRIWYSKTKSEPTRFYTRTEQAFEGPIPAVEFDYKLEGPILRDVAQNIPGLLLTNDIDLVVTLTAPDTTKTTLTKGVDFTITGSLTEAKVTLTFLRNIEQNYAVDIHTNEYAGATKELTNLTFSNINNVIVNEVDSDGNITQLVASEDYEISGQGSDNTAEVTILKPIVQGHSFVVVDKGLDDVLYVPAGDVYIRNRHDDYILRSSMSIRSYYKLKQLGHVGHEAPEYLLWEVKPGDAQKAEPSTEDANDFYVYSNDERIGTSCLESSRNAARFSGNSAGYGTITNIVVLPPDITSPYRRIQITSVNGLSTYYYYYDVIPVELHAYVNGSVADLNLSSVAGVQTEQTVICPYLIPTQNGYNEKITNADFLTTEEWMAAKASGKDYREFYSADSFLDKTFEIENLHDEVEIVGGNYLTNRAGVFSGFSAADYLKILKERPTHTEYTGAVVLDTIEQMEVVLRYKTPAVPQATSNGDVIVGASRDYEGLMLVRSGSTDSGHPNLARVSIGTPTAASTPGWIYSLYSLTALVMDTWYNIKVAYENELLQLWLQGPEDENYVLQSEVEAPVGSIIWQQVTWLGHAAGWSAAAFCEGAIDLSKSHIILNNRMWWGNKVVPYAKDGEGNFIREYAYNKQPEYQNEFASNVYETNPSGYTVVGNAPDVDGWKAVAAASAGQYLGTAINTKFIDIRNDSYISLKFRSIIDRSIASDANIFNLDKQAINIGTLALAIKNAGQVHLWMGRSATNAWLVTAVATTIRVLPLTEYFVEFYCDFTKKYILQDGKYVEDASGQYLYTLRFTPWAGPGVVTKSQEWKYLTTHRFGQGTLDNYLISGVGQPGYTLGNMPCVNMYSVEVNGRHLFTDNIHVVDRNANATALPKISANNEEESYVVVANGITEDVVLATPQQVIDRYTQDTVIPVIDNSLAVAQQTYNQYNNTMRQTYLDGIEALQQASDAVTHSELAQIYPTIYTWKDGVSGFRIWAKDSYGYYAMQWGRGAATSGTQTINLFLEMLDVDYTPQVTCIGANAGDQNWTATNLGYTSFVISNTEAFATSWVVFGYVKESEVIAYV